MDTAQPTSGTCPDTCLDATTTCRSEEKLASGVTVSYQVNKPAAAAAAAEPLCARSLLLWLVASGGTGITIAIILAITWAAQPKAMRSTLSHNFISINPLDADAPTTPQTYLRDHSRSVIPVPVHSHNDYWRPRPLYSALAAGCMAVEADIWLSPDGADLLVGHHASQLSEARTLQSLYLDPLEQILDKLNPARVRVPGGVPGGPAPNGVYQSSPGTTLVLLLDVKGNATDIWPVVDKQLQPLRERGYLSRLEYDATANPTAKPVLRRGPITVVGTGSLTRSFSSSSSPSSNVTGIGCDALSRYPDSFLDAPLGSLADASNFGTLPGCRADSLLGLPLAKFHTASAPFPRELGTVLTSLSASQRGKMRASLQAAAARNLTSRYWGTPAWPISRRDLVWRALVEEGVGLLNADDIESAARLEWNRAYRAELVWMGVSSAYMLVASLVIAYLYDRSGRNRMRNVDGIDGIGRRGGND
ncbi:hypothetical protein EsDP_00002659 [Epichloe bromicola]|uniref:Altered inheritance of mitochondria protein 6 n=1 Tax=Epichloe bromicola TaxID=79588 RepID=A0ABQ0CLF7_9HYPO